MNGDERFGILASVIGYFGFRFLEPKLSDYGIDISTISGILESNQLVFVVIAMILIGGFIGTISARLAIQKYLRNPSK